MNIEIKIHRNQRGKPADKLEDAEIHVIGAAKTVLIPSAQNAERVQSAIEGGATRASMQ
jgi:hypothetical protein